MRNKMIKNVLTTLYDFDQENKNKKTTKKKIKKNNFSIC